MRKENVSSLLWQDRGNRNQITVRFTKGFCEREIWTGAKLRKALLGDDVACAEEQNPVEIDYII